MASCPFAGAWIKTFHAARGEIISRRRPFTGAWIETTLSMVEIHKPNSSLSHRLCRSGVGI
jgi:hypothetical protein